MVQAQTGILNKNRLSKKACFEQNINRYKQHKELREKKENRIVLASNAFDLFDHIFESAIIRTSFKG